ncbi:pyridoxamine 5'-phosphate oxidase family protein [Labrenzia sp. 011]|uniref:pyridoxamine 5'-phosphate oxidase family protein n=1 Tax=Labrenzia sp. 011 TaxID=2171494 RepID=UPI000D50CF0B|nr:pyridoxamine 5'-phosphate oxidase family protein [Labrenzia sp. 011]PVB63564.1 flavin-nucleotide-binding protein [Labrenzia sp. 011]
MTTLSSLDQLHAHYGEPGEASLIKEIGHLNASYRAIVEAARFCSLTTCGPEGLDCSPRGDDGAVVRIRDERTLLLPDRSGNNRIDSLRNIVRDPRVSLMFMVSGWNNVLRVNGEAVVCVDPELLASFEKEGRLPRSVIVITIDRVYFQCARAIMRARLWDPETRVSRGDLPTPGMIMHEIQDSFDGKAYDEDWPERAAKSMW